MPNQPVYFDLPTLEITSAETLAAPTIEVATVPQLPGLPERISPNALGYLGYGHTSEVTWDDGLRPQVPMGAKRSAKVDMVRVHTGCAVKHVTWVALRVSQKPVLPSRKASGDNEVRARGSILTFNPSFTPDGTPIWAVMGDVTFWLQLMPADEDEIDFPTTVLDVEAAGAHAIGSGNFAEYLRLARPVSGFSGSKIEF